MKVKILAQLQSMAENEIMSMVNKDTLARIKQTDNSPEIRVYVVGHEGKAEPNMIGGSRTVFQYFKEAILKLGNRLKEGILAFKNHVDGTNSHTNRVPVAEVIGKSVKEINGRLSTLAALYIYPEHRKENLDIASIEADVEYSIDKSGIAQVDEFLDISGIALGDSRVNRPAFAGATLLATMQAFEQSKRGNFTHQKGDKMTLDEIKQAIKEGNLSPSDVFNEGQLTGDATVKKALNKAEQTGYEHHRNKTERDLGKPIEEFVKESNQKVKDLEAQRDAANHKLNLTKTTEVFKSLSVERKLDDKQTAFIQRSIRNANLQAKDESELKVEINKLIDSGIKDYEETAKMLGVEVKKEEADKGDNKNSPSGDDRTSTEDVDSYTDPKKNDLIPQ